MRSRSSCLFAALACGLLLSPAALPAQGIAGVIIDGSQVSVTVSLPGGIAADVLLRFEQVVGLSLANLGLGVGLVNPLDPALLARLPSGAGTIPVAFPVLLTIEPPASGGLSFSGLVSLELHTSNLLFTLGCPLRLFAAPAGGPFEDITSSMGMGSYRARGSRGDFSEFLIAIDLRSKDSVARGKFAALRARLDQAQPSIEPSVFTQLDDLLDSALAAYNARKYLQAADLVATFSLAVKAASGSGIPDVWRSARDLVNVAGGLRSAADSLVFSIQLRRSSLL